MMKKTIQFAYATALLLISTLMLSGCSLDKLGDLGKVEYVIENKTDAPISIEGIKDGAGLALDVTEIPAGESATIMTTTASNLDEVVPSLHFDKLKITQIVDGQEVSLLDDLSDANWEKKFVGYNTLQLILVVN